MFPPWRSVVLAIRCAKPNLKCLEVSRAIALGVGSNKGVNPYPRAVQEVGANTDARILAAYLIAIVRADRGKCFAALRLVKVVPPLISWPEMAELLKLSFFFVLQRRGEAASRAGLFLPSFLHLFEVQVRFVCSVLHPYRPSTALVQCTAPLNFAFFNDFSIFSFIEARRLRWSDSRS